MSESGDALSLKGYWSGFELQKRSTMKNRKYIGRRYCRYSDFEGLQ
jgi:hypothetical protein